MDIHKPKPIHNWREFLSEISIIVIGVLIALAGEQLVENFHWSHEAETQRKSLLAEAKDGLSSVKRRGLQQPCVDRRLAEMRLLLERQAQGKALGIIGKFAQPTLAESPQGSWEIALAGQALPHMDEKERLEFSSVFNVFRSWQQDTDKEAAIWSRLSMFRNIQFLNEGDWSNLHGAYSEAVVLNEQRRLFTAYILNDIGRGVLRMDATAVASNPAYERLDREICKPYVAGSDETGA